jgi:hypothetical protein
VTPSPFSFGVILGIEIGVSEYIGPKTSERSRHG